MPSAVEEGRRREKGEWLYVSGETPLLLPEGGREGGMEGGGE